MTNTTDPRLIAAVKAWDHHWGDCYGDEAVDEMGEEVAVAIGAADQTDREQGIHRITINDEAMERMASAIDATAYMPDEGLMSWNRRRVRAVLAALTGEGGADE